MMTLSVVDLAANVSRLSWYWSWRCISKEEGQLEKYEASAKISWNPKRQSV